MRRIFFRMLAGSDLQLSVAALSIVRLVKLQFLIAQVAVLVLPRSRVGRAIGTALVLKLVGPHELHVPVVVARQMFR